MRNPSTQHSAFQENCKQGFDKCELSRNLRISVTRNENVPRHFFALARFLSAFGKGAAACQN